ncbi:MAG: hypothetical protein V4727_05385 [Verrucomicrobiota bacterium]
MKNALKILALIILLGVIYVIGVFTYYEPQSILGNIYLKSKYHAEEQDLRSISEHLKETNGGSLPESFDKYLFNKLVKTKEDSTEYKNILGFYADQSISSNAGMKIFEEGSQYLPSIIRYGRAASTEQRQKSFLFLAYGIAQKREAPSPMLNSQFSMDKNFTFIEEGNLSEVGIGSYKP